MPIKVYLSVTAGPSRGTARDFSQGKLTLGRGRVELILFDKKVSAQHCTIRVDGDICWLDDLKSTNGTFVNGKKVEGSIELNNLDEIVIGLSKIAVSIVEELSEFKKANSVEAATPKVTSREPMEDEENSQAPTRRSASSTTTDTEEFRETGVKRIDSLIEDEMATFSKWDHPQIEDPKDPTGSIPKIKVLLKQQKGADGLTSFVCAKPVNTLGRKGVDVKLNDLDCSRLHAQIEIVGGNRAFLKDHGSTNGTFVNGKRITMQEINSGDLIQIGQSVFEVTIESGTT